MSPEKQRIAIAEACGWKQINAEWDHWSNGAEIQHRQNLPRYLTDLNAMNEAEKVLTFSQRQVYYDNLRLVCSAGLPDGVYVADIECSKATAAQRAEAFLRTLNLWQK